MTCFDYGDIRAAVIQPAVATSAPAWLNQHQPAPGPGPEGRHSCVQGSESLA